MHVIRLATHAMGTRFEIVLGGRQPERLRPAGEAALAEIEEWHGLLSLFDPGSFVSYINAHASRREVELDDLMLDLLLEADAVRRDSGGAFDIAVAPLMRAWGFHGGGEVAVRDDDLAARDEGVHHSAGGDAVVIDRNRRTIRFTRPGVAIDLGGIGKGYALDRAAAGLRENGVDTALLHGGTSTVVAIGAPPQRDGWRVGIGGTSTPTVVTLRDRALSVSAQHGREIEVGGRRRGHVLDPRTGAPAETASLAAVVGPSARRADAWSTTLLVRGDRPDACPDDYASLIACAAPEGDSIRVDEPVGKMFQFEESAARSGVEEVR